MGPYDNETEQYIFDEDIMEGAWFSGPDTQALYIVPRGDGYDEVFGPDDDVCEALRILWRNDCLTIDGAFTRGQLEFAANELGLSIIDDVLKRFDPKVGYYHA